MKEGFGMPEDNLTIENITTKGEGQRLLFVLNEEAETMKRFLAEAEEALTQAKDVGMLDWKDEIERLKGNIEKHETYIGRVREKMAGLPG